MSVDSIRVFRDRYQIPDPDDKLDEVPYVNFGTGSFFFSSRRRHTMLTCDWSSDVCSSDLAEDRAALFSRPGPDRGQDEHGKAHEGRRLGTLARSEERRVGKECRSRWSP